MKPFLAKLALSAAILMGVAGDAQAFPAGPGGQGIRDSGLQLVGRRVGGRVFRPVIPRQTPMRNPAVPSVPLPPPSTAAPPTVNR
jgi:hypothetical protein